MQEEPQYIDKVYSRLKADSKGKMTIDAETFKNKMANEDGYADKVYSRLKADSKGKLTITLDEFKDRAIVKKKESTDGSITSNQSESGSEVQLPSTQESNIPQEQPIQKRGEFDIPIPNDPTQERIAANIPKYEKQVAAQKAEIENSIGAKLNELDLNPDYIAQKEAEYERLQKEKAGQGGVNLTAAPKAFQDKLDDAKKEYDEIQSLKELKNKIVFYEENKDLGLVDTYKEYLKTYNEGKYQAITTREDREDEYLNEKFKAQLEGEAIDFASDAIRAKYSQIESAIGYDKLKEINDITISLGDYSKELENVQAQYENETSQEKRNILAEQYNALLNDPKINKKVDAYEKMLLDPLYQQFQATQEEYQKLYDYSKNYLDKYPKVVDMNKVIEKQQLDFDEAYRNSSWVGQVATDIEQTSKRVLTKLIKDGLTLPRSLSQSNDWGWTDDLAETVEEYVDIYDNMAATMASNQQLPLRSDVATSKDGSVQIILDDKGIPTTARDKEGFKLDKFTEGQLIKDYTENPDNYKLNTGVWQTQTLFPKTIKMMGDMGVMFAGAGATTKGMKLFGGSQKLSETVGLSGSVIGQTHNDAYNTGLENGLNPAEASRYSMAVSAAISLIAQINPQKYIYTNEGAKKFSQDFAKTVFSKSKVGSFTEGAKFMIKEGIKEAAEEVAEIPAQAFIGAAANAMTSTSTFDNTQNWNEYVESAVLGFIGGGIFGIGGVKSSSTLQREAFDYALENLETFNKSVDNMVGKTIWQNGKKKEVTAQMAEQFKNDVKVIAERSDSIYELAEFSKEEKSDIADLQKTKYGLERALDNPNLDDNVAEVYKERINMIDDVIQDVIREKDPTISGEKVSSIIPEEEVVEEVKEESPVEEVKKEEPKSQETTKAEEVKKPEKQESPKVKTTKNKKSVKEVKTPKEDVKKEDVKGIEMDESTLEYHPLDFKNQSGIPKNEAPFQKGVEMKVGRSLVDDGQAIFIDPKERGALRRTGWPYSIMQNGKKVGTLIKTTETTPDYIILELGMDREFTRRADALEAFEKEFGVSEKSTEVVLKNEEPPKKEKAEEKPSTSTKDDGKIGVGSKVVFRHLDGSQMVGTIEEEDAKGRYKIIDEDGRVNRIPKSNIIGKQSMSKLDKAKEEINKLQQEAFEDVKTAGPSTGGKVRRNKVNDSDKLSERIKNKNPEIEKRLQESSDWTLSSDTWAKKTKEQLRGIKDSFRRRYVKLNPNKYGRESDILRGFERLRDRATQNANEVLKGLLEPLTREQKNLLERLVYINDLKRGIEKGIDKEGELPHGFETKKQVDEYAAQLEKELETEPRVKAAYRARNLYMEGLHDELVKYKIIKGDDAGFQAYFHRRTLEYMDDEKSSKILSGKKLKKSKRGFTIGRKGSGGKDYSTNYIESEFKSISDSIFEIEKAKTLEKLMKPYEVKRKEYKKKAAEMYENELLSMQEEYGSDDPMVEKFKELKTQYIKQQILEMASNETDEEYTWYQPKEGNVMFSQEMVTAEKIDKIIEEFGETPSGDSFTVLQTLIDEARKFVVLGPKNKEYLIPTVLAETLTELGTPKLEQDIGKSFLRGVVANWKAYVLLNPFGVVRYNLNNMAGDLDKVVAVDKTIFKNVRRAIGDMYAYTFSGKINKDVQEALDLDVINSGFEVSELSKISKESWARYFFKSQMTLEDLMGPKGFARLMGKALNPKSYVKTYFNFVTKLSGFRENILRYSAFLRAKEKIAKGETFYWASNANEIDAIKDPLDKAAKLARETLGDYNNLSYKGQQLRKAAMPFYSWTEVNFKAYNNLLKNASNPNVKRTVAGLAMRRGLTRIGVEMFIKFTEVGMFTALVSLWNKVGAPAYYDDDFEDWELANIRGLQIIAGRDEVTGEVRAIPIVGAYMDYLEWFGLPGVFDEIEEVLEQGKPKGEAAKDALTEVAFAPINKIVQGYNPFIKIPAELLFRVQSFPDIRSPRPVYDRVEYIASSFRVKDMYKKMMDIPNRKDPDGLNWIKNQMVRPINVQQAIYYDVRNLVSQHKGGLVYKEGDDEGKNEMREAQRNYTSAVRYEDEELKKKWLDIYLEKGGTKSKLKSSLKRKSPIEQLEKDEKRAVMDRLSGKKTDNEWANSLTSKELRKIEVALKYYEETFVKAANELSK